MVDDSIPILFFFSILIFIDIFNDLVVEPTVVNTVSNTSVSVEKVRLPLERSTFLLQELKVLHIRRQLAIRKPIKIRI